MLTFYRVILGFHTCVCEVGTSDDINMVIQRATSFKFWKKDRIYAITLPFCPNILFIVNLKWQTVTCHLNLID